jgi:hypothetical protein
MGALFCAGTSGFWYLQPFGASPGVARYGSHASPTLKNVSIPAVFSFFRRERTGRLGD